MRTFICDSLGNTLLVLAMMWLSVFSCDLINAFKIPYVWISPVLFTEAGIALGLCLGIVLVIASLAAFTAGGVRRLLGIGYDRMPCGAFEMATSCIASAVIVWRPGMQEWEVFVIVPVCVLVTVLAVMLGIVVPAQLRRYSWWLWSILGLIVWNYVARNELIRHESYPCKLSVMFGSAGVTLLIVSVAFDKASRRVRFVLRSAALLIGLVGPLATVQVTSNQPICETSNVSNTPPEGFPNVLIFLVDTLRADHMSPWGDELETTPHLQQVVKQRTTIFENAWSGGTSTVPSVKSLFTSRYPSQWGLGPAGKMPPPLGVWTLARAFRKSGYATAGFSGNGSIRGKCFAQGFEEYWVFGGFTAAKDSFLIFRLLCKGILWRAFRLVRFLRVHKTRGETVWGMARDYLYKERNRPFFIYIHIVEPHWPYYEHGYGLIPDKLADLENPLSFVDLLRLSPGKPNNARFRNTRRLREMLGRYDEEIRHSDEVYRQMLADLRDMNLIDSTLVIVLADHGEEFFEHNGFSHGHDVFEEQAHVPMIFHWPNGDAYRKMPHRITTPVSLNDVLPTLTDYLDLFEPRNSLAGRSLRTPLEGDEGFVPVITEAFRGKKCCTGYREGPLVARLIFSGDVSPLRTKRVSVFDLDSDPKQIRRLTPTDSRLKPFMKRARNVLHERWLDWPDRKKDDESRSKRKHPTKGEKLGRPQQQKSSTPRKLDDDALNQLRALGYIE